MSQLPPGKRAATRGRRRRAAIGLLPFRSRRTRQQISREEIVEAERRFLERRPKDARWLLELAKNGIVVAQWCRALLARILGEGEPESLPREGLVLRLGTLQRAREIDFGRLLRGDGALLEAPSASHRAGSSIESLRHDEAAIRALKILSDDEVAATASASLWAHPKRSKRVRGQVRHVVLETQDLMEIAAALGLESLNEPVARRRARWAKRKAAIARAARLLRNSSATVFR